MSMNFSLQMGGIAVDIDAAGKVRLAIPTGAQTLTSHEFMVLAKILESASQLALPPQDKPAAIVPVVAGLSVTNTSAVAPPSGVEGAQAASPAEVAAPRQPGRQVLSAAEESVAPPQKPSATADQNFAVTTAELAVANEPEVPAAEAARPAEIAVSSGYQPAKPVQIEALAEARVAGRPNGARIGRAQQASQRLGGDRGSQIVAKTRSGARKGRPRGPDALPTAVRWPEFSNIGRRPGRVTVAGRAILPARAAIAAGPRNPGRSSAPRPAETPSSAEKAVRDPVAAMPSRPAEAIAQPAVLRPAPVAATAPAQVAVRAAQTPAARADIVPQGAQIAASTAPAVAMASKIAPTTAVPTASSPVAAPRTPLMQGREFAALVVEWMASNPGPRTQDEIVAAAQQKGWTTRENARHLVETSLPRYRELFARHIDGTLQRRADFLPNVVVAGKVHRRRPDGTPSPL